jgi:hypothetical protein
MNPLYWGAAGWHFLHAIALSYPDNPTDKDKDDYRTFFDSLVPVLPCPACSNHYRGNMLKYPIRLNNRLELFRWTVDMHNEVNVSKGKKVYTYEEAYEEFRKNGEYYAGKKTKEEVLVKQDIKIRMELKVLIILMILGVGLFIYKKK